MTGTKPEQETFRFAEARQERIYRRLSLVGPGPAAFYLDACRLMEGKPRLETTTHAVSHFLREIESSIRDVLETVTPGKESLKGLTHRAEVLLILEELSIPESDPLARTWLKLTEKSSGLHARAHRDSLDSLREVDEPFQQFWNDIQSVLDI